MFKTNYCYIYWLNWFGYSLKLSNVQPSWLQRTTSCQILYLAEEYTRDQHHIAFLSNYIKQRKIPKEFRLKLHFNIANLEYEDAIKKGSLKLMQITINNYERSILTTKTDFDKVLAKINFFWLKLLQSLRSFNQRNRKIWRTFT